MNNDVVIYQSSDGLVKMEAMGNLRFKAVYE